MRRETGEARGAAPEDQGAGGFLREQRARRGMSLSELARHVGVHPMSILRWERRERFPGPAHILALARALDVAPARVTTFFDVAREPSPALGARGHGLRRLRWSAGLSGTTIGCELGVRPSTIYNWESGRARIPEDLIDPLAQMLGLAVPSLLGELRAAPAVPSRRLHAASPLRALRWRSGLSQERAAQRAGTHRRALSAWERGNGRPPLAVVRRLATAYGVSVAELARAAGVVPPTALDRDRWKPGDLPRILRTLREWAGITQAELASRCDCGVSTVRSWERGRAVPSARMRRRLEAAFGLRESDLRNAIR